jgi:GDP-L-fucose synthase
MASEKYNGPQHLNVGTGYDLTIKDLAHLISNEVGYEGGIKWDTTKPDGTPRKILDVSRITAMGWKPTITLAEGVASTILWFKEAVASGEARL